MLDSFVVAVNAVVPFLCYLALGSVSRRFGAVDIFLNRLTKLIFTVMLPFMTFNVTIQDPLCEDKIRVA